MKLRPLAAAALFATLAGPARAQAPAHPDALPAQRIAPERLGGFTQALTLANPTLRVVVLPEAGRIVELSTVDGDQALRQDRSMFEAGPREPVDGQWANYGGDWLWPVAQSRWAAHFGRTWPPPPWLDSPWQGHAWRNVDGSQTCRIEVEYGAPLHIRVSRTMQLDRTAPRLRIRQRIERLAPSAVPVCLWNVSQIAGAEEAVLPHDDDSAFAEGYRILDYDPVTELLTTCPQALVFSLDRGTEHKLGFDSRRGWIAARRGRLVQVERMAPADGDGTYPDGGCRLELYSNRGLGYTEIETLSEERALKPGEVLENELTFEVFAAPEPTSGCDLAQRVREWIGEQPPAEAPSLRPSP